ncbi:MAG: hypothetical protein VXZ72_01000 [Chlamydiota bacterium]|nr:hypothetical protein [Chlamydiota bacterium]
MATTNSRSKTAKPTNSKTSPSAEQQLLDGFRTVLSEELSKQELEIPAMDVSISDADVDRIATATEAHILKMIEGVDFSKLEEINKLVDAMQIEFPGIAKTMEAMGKDDSKSKEESERYSSKDLLAAAKELGDEKLTATIEFQNKFIHWRVWEHKQTRGLVAGALVGAGITIAIQRYLAGRAGEEGVEGDLDADLTGEDGVAFEVMSA